MQSALMWRGMGVSPVWFWGRGRVTGNHNKSQNRIMNKQTNKQTNKQANNNNNKTSTKQKQSIEISEV